MTIPIPSQQMVDHIHRYIDFEEIHPIAKGYSIDQKYLLTARTGEKYLVRITESDDIRVLTARRDQFELIRKMNKFSSLVPHAYYFWFADYAQSCVMILAYAEGEDGEQALGQLSEGAQYKIGYRSGEELKKLHQLPAPSEVQPWHYLKRRKYEWYCSGFQRMKQNPEGIDLGIIDTFIRKHIHLMEKVPQTFQHDDYHPANMILQNEDLIGIIDFNRCDWGDPIHDFNKIGFFTRNISVPFARGQVDGYFHHQIPPDFWDRYALYCAMSIIPDLVWSRLYECRTGSDGEVEKSLTRIRIVYADHDGFSSAIPRWYSDE